MGHIAPIPLHFLDQQENVTARTDDLMDFSSDLSKILDQIPELRRELHEELAEMLQLEVRQEINNSNFNHGGNKLRRWQQMHVGSYGGYAAVRPVNKRVGEYSATGDNSPGAITNYNEGGHRIRSPKGKAKRYKPKIKISYVDGRNFYQRARVNAESAAISIVEKFADRLADAIESGGL